MRWFDPPQTKSSPVISLPRLEPRVTWRFLKGLSGLALILAMVAGGHWLMHLESQYLPVRVVSIEGEVRRMTLQQIQERVGMTLEAGILTQDLATIQAAIKELPWVDNAGVRRAWPDRLVIAVTEHKPLARWGDDRLVTAEGVIFRPERHEIPAGLPRLRGPEDQSRQVTQRYLTWGDLLKTRGLSILTLEDDARGAWTLTTDAGFTLLLGKAEVEMRLERFLRAYPEILAAGRPARIDMRYSNGLAVSWSGARLAAWPTGRLGYPLRSESSYPGPATATRFFNHPGSPDGDKWPYRS